MMNESEFKSKIDELNKENNVLRENIQNLHNLLAYDICQYFNKCNSLKKTANKFYFENVKQCYETLIEFNDDSYLLEKAVDFIECYKDIFSKEYRK